MVSRAVAVEAYLVEEVVGPDLVAEAVDTEDKVDRDKVVAVSVYEEYIMGKREAPPRLSLLPPTRY